MFYFSFPCLLGFTKHTSRENKIYFFLRDFKKLQAFWDGRNRPPKNLKKIRVDMEAKMKLFCAVASSELVFPQRITACVTNPNGPIKISSYYLTLQSPKSLTEISLNVLMYKTFHEKLAQNLKAIRLDGEQLSRSFVSFRMIMLLSI